MNNIEDNQTIIKNKARDYIKNLKLIKTTIIVNQKYLNLSNKMRKYQI